MGVSVFGAKLNFEASAGFSACWGGADGVEKNDGGAVALVLAGVDAFASAGLGAKNDVGGLSPFADAPNVNVLALAGLAVSAGVLPTIGGATVGAGGAVAPKLKEVTGAVVGVVDPEGG